MAISQGLKNSLNKIREVSSEIYHQYIPIIDDDTDIGKFASPILTVPEVYNEFVSALINRIVYTQVDVKMFNNPLRALEGATMPLGYAGQEIYINPAKGRRYNPEDFAGILQKYEADIKVQYLVKNMDLQYPVTVIRTKLKEAFVTWEALDSFIGGLTQSLYNGMYIDEWRYTKALVSSAYKSNNVQVEVIQEPNTEALAKAFIQKARTLFLNFQNPSVEFNAWHKVGGSGKPITTWSEAKDIVILLRNDIRSYIDVNVLASAFNIDSTTLLGNMYGVDSFDVYSDEGEKIFDGSNIFGMIADRNWFKIKPIDTFMEDQRNANNRSIQYYLNNIKMYEYSLFANAKVFATSEADIETTSLEFVETNPRVAPEKELYLHIATNPANGSTPISYSVEDDNVLSIEKIDNKTVKVTGVAEGSTTLTAETSTGISKEITVLVANPEIIISDLDAGTVEVTVAEGDTEGIELTVTPANGNTPIFYTSSNTEVFTVEKDETANNKCTITGVADGSATLIATTGKVTELITVHVVAV